MSTPGWLAAFPVTDSWEAHRTRGSLGGIDWGTPAGTPIYAPSSGTLDFRFFGDGSSVLRVKRPDGSATEFLHGRMAGAPRTVRPDEQIGTSDGRKGALGAGPSTGAHLHVHDVTARGVRVPPFTTIGAALAGLGTATLKQRTNGLMYIKGKSADIYAIWTDANGHARMRPTVGEEGSYAKLGGLVIEASDESLVNVARACGYYDPLPLPKVEATASVKLTDAELKKIGQSVPAANLIIAGTARPEGITK